MKGLEFLDVMTPIEKFWVLSTATMFLTQKGDKLINAAFISFPIFLRLFREILKELGMKNLKKIMKDWEWLIYATFLTIISLKNFGKPKLKEKQQIYMIKDGNPYNEDDSFIIGLIKKIEQIAKKNKLKLNTEKFDETVYVSNPSNRSESSGDLSEDDFIEDDFIYENDYDDGSGMGLDSRRYSI